MPTLSSKTISRILGTGIVYLMSSMMFISCQKEMGGSDNLLANGDFNKGLYAWNIMESGNEKMIQPLSAGIFPPNAEKEHLEMGVFGGSCSAFQGISTADIELYFYFDVRAEQWSTQGGKDSGVVQVSISFLGTEQKHIGSLNFYISPNMEFKSKKDEYWEKLGESVMSPGNWHSVSLDVMERVEGHLEINKEDIQTVKVIASVNGTHGDKTHTIGAFDSFHLYYRWAV